MMPDNLAAAFWEQSLQLVVMLQGLLTEEQQTRLATCKILLVGAGGIGSELLKDLVQLSVGEVHLIDLDTIDLSNLNRQFLFSSRHIKQPKAKIAAETAAQFNTQTHVIPYYRNILDEQFSPKWFSSFDLVFNALDNTEAREHVNHMCVATKVPLIDAGTAGFDGQVQVIVPGVTECYGCFSHPAPVSYPICTIRSTPSKPVHCIVWAKSYLFNLIFGQDPDNDDLNAEVTEENKDEIKRLSAEKEEHKALREAREQPDFIKLLLQKIFVDDINRLLSMSSMWDDRQKPEPLEIPNEIDQTEFKIQSQTSLSYEQCLQVLASTSSALAKRATSGILEFDKDDEDAMAFVAAAANLRAMVFHIPQKTLFEIKEIAGNIIPSIATTNAVVSGLAVLEGIKTMLKIGTPKNVNMWRTPSSLLSSEKTSKPNKDCAVCGVARVDFVGNTGEVTLGQLVNDFLKLELNYSDVSLVADNLLYDPDFDDNINKTLKELSLSDKFITVIDDDERRNNLELYISVPTNDKPRMNGKPDFKIAKDLKRQISNDSLEELPTKHAKTEDQEEDDDELFVDSQVVELD